MLVSGFKKKIEQRLDFIPTKVETPGFYPSNIGERLGVVLTVDPS